MTVPVIGAEDPGPETEPIVWAKPPARPEPIDIGSLDPDKLTELLRKRPPKMWAFWIVFAVAMLAMHVLPLLLSRPWRAESRPTPVAATTGLLLYSAAGLVFISLAAAAFQAAARGGPRYRLNQALLIGGVALSLVAGLPWPVFMWGQDGVGRYTAVLASYWPIYLGCSSRTHRSPREKRRSTDSPVTSSPSSPRTCAIWSATPARCAAGSASRCASPSSPRHLSRSGSCARFSPLTLWAGWGSCLTQPHSSPGRRSSRRSPPSSPGA